jgi:hypothetical protein
MNKKLEYHKEYPEVVYKDRVYRWFNNNTSTLSDVDLQKFVNDAIAGNLTFQCADEIDIDDPDISMIDHLLMDIASEKNDELINTYTDEIDWDNDYIEKYNKASNMDKKLESRITRLEKFISCKNESITKTLSKNEISWIYDVLDSIERMCDMIEDLNYKSYKLNIELSDIDDLLLRVTNSLDETRSTLEEYMIAIEEQKTL